MSNSLGTEVVYIIIMLIIILVCIHTVYNSLYYNAWVDQRRRHVSSHRLSK